MTIICITHHDETQHFVTLEPKQYMRKKKIIDFGYYK